MRGRHSSPLGRPVSVLISTIKKEWDFQFDGERRRLHSATEMKCLWYLVHFLNFHARLPVFDDPGSPYAVINFPLKCFHSTHVVPPGVTDVAGVLPTLQNKVAAYELWVQRMQADYATENLSILESVNEIDLLQFKSVAIYPLQYVKKDDGKEGYVLVFVPGFRHKQENREEINCKSYRVGYLIFGRNYQPGHDTSLDFMVFGYFVCCSIGCYSR